MTYPAQSTAEVRARKRVKDLSGLIWHAGIFLVVNAFLWLQDIAVGGGVEYAYWTTIPWGAGLAIHALAFFFGPGAFEERKYVQYPEEERRREAAAIEARR